MRTLCGMDLLGAQDYEVGTARYSVGGDRYSVGLFDFDIASIFKAGGELAQQGVNYKNAEDKKTTDKAAADAKLAAILAADQAATDASAQALYSADIAANAPEASKAAMQAKANADAALALQMSNAQDLTAAGASPDVVAKRVEAVTKALTDATKKAADVAKAFADAPKDAAKKAASDAAQFRVKAAQITAVKAASGQSAQSTGRQPTPEEQMKMLAALQAQQSAGESFLMKKIGPLPTWGWGAAILALVAAIFGMKKYLG